MTLFLHIRIYDLWSLTIADYISGLLEVNLVFLNVVFEACLLKFVER